MLSQKNERICFTTAQIRNANEKISAAISEGQEVIRSTKKFLDTTTESIHGILELAKNNLDGLAREITDLHKQLSDIGEEMANMADLPKPSGKMFQNPNAPYRGNHNYDMLSSQLAQHTALFGTPSAAFEKLKKEQSFLEGELRGLERRKSELEYVIRDCEAHIKTLQSIREDLCQSREDPLAPLYHAKSIADMAEGCGSAAAREMGLLIGMEGRYASLLVDSDQPSAFGKAAAGLKSAIFQMRSQKDELQRRMREHRRSLMQSPIMDATEQAVNTEILAAQKTAEGIEQKIHSLLQIEKNLKEYRSLANA